MSLKLPPTRKRLLEARISGDVAFSKPLAGAIAGLALTVSLALFTPAWFDTLAATTTTLWTLAALNPPPDVIIDACRSSLMTLFTPVLLLLAALTLFASITALFIIGSPHKAAPLRLDLSHLNPGQHLRHLSSGETSIDAVLQCLRIATLSLIALHFVFTHQQELLPDQLKHVSLVTSVNALTPGDARQDEQKIAGGHTDHHQVWPTQTPAHPTTTLKPHPPTALNVPAPKRSHGIGSSRLAQMTLEFALRLGVAALLLGLIDLMFARLFRRRRLAMTRVEIERERLEQERSPLMKRRLRRSWRRNRQPSSPEAVTASSFVIASPAGAVALSYQRGAHRAPEIIAIGLGQTRDAIIARARALGAIVTFDHDIACALVTLTPGAVLPAHLWRPVARLMSENAFPMPASRPDRRIVPPQRGRVKPRRKNNS